MSHLWKLCVTFYVVTESLLLHKKWHVTFRAQRGQPLLLDAVAGIMGQDMD